MKKMKKMAKTVSGGALLAKQAKGLKGAATSSSMAAGMDKQIKTAKSAGPVTQTGGAAATKKQTKSLLMR